MFDWKRKIDDDEARKEAARRAREEQEKQQRLAQEQEREKREKQEYERKLREHQRKFKCYICGKPSNGPVKSERVSYDGESCTHVRSVNFYTDWDDPTGLTRCNECRNWCCNLHIYRGICQKCAEKL